jgi:hypothetical protein
LAIAPLQKTLVDKPLLKRLVIAKRKTQNRAALQFLGGQPHHVAECGIYLLNTRSEIQECDPPGRLRKQGTQLEFRRLQRILEAFCRGDIANDLREAPMASCGISKRDQSAIAKK